MNSDLGSLSDSELVRELREVNEALLASSIRQHELNEQARRVEQALRKSEAALRSQAEELASFNRAALGRESRILELKEEINELAQQHGEPPRYSLEFEAAEPLGEARGTSATQSAEARTAPSEAVATLEAILCIQELTCRVSHPPDYQKESRALGSLLQTLADSPDDVLQQLAQKILEVLRADSAGLSVLTPEEERFSWLAIAGAWESYVGGSTPRDLGPCGDAFDQNAPLLLRQPERRYAYFKLLTPPVKEALLAPFYVSGKPVGAVWAVAHGDRQFDAEDLRELSTFSRFASVAYQATQVHKVEVSRRAAAFNLLQDAVRAREAVDKTNRELRAANERFSALMESAPDAIVVADEHGTIVLVNARTETLFGYTRQELLGKAVEVLMPERFRAMHPAHRSSYVQAPVLRPMGANLELYVLHRDGSEIPVEISLSPMRTPAGLQVVSAIRDISDRKRVLEELREARNEADKASRAKSSFLATASHDLRQPLQTLALLNGALRRMVHDPDSAQALAQQEGSISVMSRLLNALLDISKLESGAVKPELTSWNISSLFDQMRNEFTGLALSKGLSLQIEPSAAWVHSDLSLIGQVVRNLLSNAIKYTHKGSVRLRCRVVESMAHVDVIDTGIGMAPQELNRIYDEFYQIGVPPNATREGYGLGLSIVSRILKLLNLQLDAHSEPGRGSTFTLRLPLADSARGSNGPHQASSELEKRESQTHHILVVDDDAAVLSATRLFLKAEGYRVSTAGSIAEALDVIRAAPAIGLVITDYHLSADETGRQLISRVRELRGPLFKVIMVTGDTSSAARGLEGDAALRFLNKPVNPAELLQLLKSLLASG